MASDLELFAYVEGLGVSAFPVTVGRSDTVGDLKEAIWKKSGNRLKDFDIFDLTLYKVEIPESDDLEQLALRASKEKLNVSREIADVFPMGCPKQTVNIVVEIPNIDVDQPPRKRGRLMGSSPDTKHSEAEAILGRFRPTLSRERWIKFWKSLWGKGLDHFQANFVERHWLSVDDKRVEFQTLKIDPAFPVVQTFKGLLIREEWVLSKSVADQRFEEAGNFIIIGQPGNGKSLSLYYMLSVRVAQGLPTFLQYSENVVWLFDKNGVQLFNPKTPWEEVPSLSEDVHYYALVDSNNNNKEPAHLLQGPDSLAFIVYASSPGERWRWTKYRQAPTYHFYTKPFSIEELLIANNLQPVPVPENNLREFFLHYGPSARENYRYSRSPESLKWYDRSVFQPAVMAMNWPKLAEAVTKKDRTSTHDAETTYTVMLIEPVDEERLYCKINVITPTVMRLLWKAHRNEIRLKGQELFSVFSRNPESSPTAGRIFESQVHDKLEIGIDEPLDPLKLKPNDHPDAVYDNWVASNVGTARWKSDPMVYMPYSSTNCDLQLKDHCYYVPVDPNFATFDSFTFETTLPASYSDPIIDLRRKHKPLLNTSRQGLKFALCYTFQATTAPEHGMKEEGLNHIIAIAEKNGFDAIAVRYVAVIPSESAADIKVPVEWRSRLGMFALAIPNYNPQPTVAAIRLGSTPSSTSTRLR